MDLPARGATDLFLLWGAIPRGSYRLSSPFLGFSPQKTKRRALEHDEEEIQHWIKEKWPRIKKASRLKAFLVFIDESGFLMAPLVGRSWGPQGQTPILYQRIHSYKKVSAIAASCLSPERRRLNLFFRLHAEAYVNTKLVRAFFNVLYPYLQITS